MSHPCKCSKPSLVSDAQKTWRCGRCSGTPSADQIPSSETLDLALDIKKRCKLCQSIGDVIDEFGPPTSHFPNSKTSAEARKEAGQYMARQAIWDFDEAVELAVVEDHDGSIRCIVGMR